MNIARLIGIALNAISRNRFRTFLTMLGIIIGVASVIVMLAIGEGAKKNIQEEISKMGTNLINVRPGSGKRHGVSYGEGSKQTLTLKDVDAIRENSSLLSAISPEVSGSGQSIFGGKNWATSIQGVGTEYLTIRKMKVASGEMFTEKDVASAAKVCLLGKTLVENLFGDEDPSGRVIRFNNIPFKVIGLIEEKGEDGRGRDLDDFVLAPYTTVQKRVLAITHINSIFASAVSEETSDEAQKEIEQILRKSHKLQNNDEDDFRVRSQQELIATFSSTSQVLTILLASIAGISLLVGGIGIMNIMYVSVTERTREIGLRMAVGARDVDILYQFLIEAVIISITGGLIGMCLGFAATLVVSGLLKWPTAISPFSIILSFLVCTFTGIFFGWYPALKASRLDPIEALRYE